MLFAESTQTIGKCDLKIAYEIECSIAYCALRIKPISSNSLSNILAIAMPMLFCSNKSRAQDKIVVELLKKKCSSS